MEEILYYLGLSSFQNHFESNNITPEIARELSENEWKELIPNIGSRHILTTYFMTENQNTQNIIYMNERRYEILGSPLHTSDMKSGIQGSRLKSSPAPTVEALSSPTYVKGSSQPDTEGDIQCHNIDDPTQSIYDNNLTPKTSLCSKRKLLFENCNLPSPSQPIKKFKISLFNQNLTLLEYLKSNVLTNAILENYKLCNSLNYRQRKEIVSSIIVGILERNNKINVKLLENIAYEMIEIFPTETIGTYYSYNKSISKNPRGKLVDRYYNELTKRKIIFGFHKKVDKENHMTDEAENIPSVSSDIKSKIEWLKYNAEPWPKVVECFNETHEVRRHEAMQSDGLFKFLQHWPIFHNPLAHDLVSYR